MRRDFIAAMLLAAITMMVVGCNKEDIIVPIEPKEKVSRIYLTNTSIMEMYNDSTQTWDTMIYLASERILSCEFFWTGDRLDSMTQGVNKYFFTYDSRGRLIHVSEGNHQQYFDIEYNTDGQVSRVYKCNLDGVDTVGKETYLFFWYDGKLQRLEDDIWALDANDSGIKHATLFYTWSGDNVSKAVCHSLYRDDSRDTVVYNYETNNLVNPFYGFPFWQLPYRKIIDTFYGTDGLNKNMLTRCYGDNMERRFEHTTTDGRVTGIHEVFTTMSAFGLSRSLIVSDFELEYVK